VGDGLLTGATKRQSGDFEMHTLMIISMDQGKGFTEEALRPVPLFEAVAHLTAALIAVARTLRVRATVHLAHA
jgi:hypothetical protein